MAREHELGVDILGMPDRLQRLLDAELRESGSLPVVPLSFWAQLENWQALRQPMQFTWSRRMSSALSGVTNTRVESGVRIASVKPCAIQPSARSRSCGVT